MHYTVSDPAVEWEPPRFTSESEIWQNSDGYLLCVEKSYWSIKKTGCKQLHPNNIQYWVISANQTGCLYLVSQIIYLELAVEETILEYCVNYPKSG